MSEPVTALEKLGAPPAVTAMLRLFRDDLIRVAGPNFAGVLLYGGLARGRFRPGKSDVNVVVLLHDLSAPALAAIAPILRAAWRGAAIEPILLTPAEVRQAADAFATKFLDIKEHHLVLAGEDPFADLEVQREHLRLRAEQELRNSVLRLRRRYVAIGDEPDELTAQLAHLARPLAVELAALLRLANRPLPAEDHTRDLFAAAAAAFDLDGSVLARLAALRGDGPPPEDAPALYHQVLGVIARAATVAAQLKEASP
jgi:hypothetical protein